MLAQLRPALVMLRRCSPCSPASPIPLAITGIAGSSSPTRPTAASLIRDGTVDRLAR